jgi:hypothetical protein
MNAWLFLNLFCIFVNMFLSTLNVSVFAWKYTWLFLLTCEWRTAFCFISSQGFICRCRLSRNIYEEQCGDRFFLLVPWMDVNEEKTFRHFFFSRLTRWMRAQKSLYFSVQVLDFTVVTGAKNFKIPTHSGLRWSYSPSDSSSLIRFTHSWTTLTSLQIYFEKIFVNTIRFLNFTDQKLNYFSLFD